jgi:hypothetical protein
MQKKRKEGNKGLKGIKERKKRRGILTEWTNERNVEKGEERK